MEELRRVRSGILSENDNMVTMHDGIKYYFAKFLKFLLNNFLHYKKNKIVLDA